jgi:type IV pilus assembly protein PilM
MIALKQQHLWPIGLQLCPHSARLVQLTGRPGALSVHAMAHQELPHDEDASPDDQDNLIASTLRKLLSDHHFKGRRVVSCLDSHELFMQNVRLPQLPDDELTKIIAFEAEERLPYPVADAEIRHLRAGRVRQDSIVKDEVILLAYRRQSLDRHIHVLEQAGLTPVAIDVEPCAALRCLRKADGKSPSEQTPRRAYLNLGETATTVVFADGDQILFLKDIGTAGHDLDRAVARHLELGLPEAAGMRRSVMAAPELDPDNEVHRSVIDAIRDPLETIASEIQFCLRYYKVTFRGTPIAKMIVTGREGSHWLAEFLSERLSTSCELADPFAALAHRPSPKTHTAEPWQWTTALGLSMRPCDSKKRGGTQ